VGEQENVEPTLSERVGSHGGTKSWFWPMGGSYANQGEGENRFKLHVIKVECCSSKLSSKSTKIADEWKATEGTCKRYMRPPSTLISTM